MSTTAQLEHVFSAKWADIALGSWLKYPNPERPDVLGLDVIDRHYDHETNTLTAYRVSLIKGLVPSWVCAMTGGCMCLFLEKSIVKPRERFMQLDSENITCNQFLSLNEVCTYTPAVEDPKGSTHFKQEMNISAHVWGFSSQIEKVGADNFLKNAIGGRDIMLRAVSLIPMATTGKVFDACRIKEDQ